MIRLSRKILSQPQNDGLRGWHHGPTGTVVGFDKHPQRIRFRPQDFIHGTIERGFERSIGLGRDKMRMRAKHAVEIADLKLFSKDINCVCAVQAKGGLLQQPVP